MDLCVARAQMQSPAVQQRPTAPRKSQRTQAVHRRQEVKNRCSKYGLILPRVAAIQQGSQFHGNKEVNGLEFGRGLVTVEDLTVEVHGQKGMYVALMEVESQRVMWLRTTSAHDLARTCRTMGLPDDAGMCEDHVSGGSGGVESYLFRRERDGG
jgi:hypothetical protein